MQRQKPMARMERSQNAKRDRDEIDVLVVGAGPTGLFLACELVGRGLSCRLIDTLTEPVTYSKAAVVHARTMEIFESLGVAGAVIARSKIIHGVSVYAGQKRVVHATLDEVDSPFPFIHGISQHDTEIVLTEHLGTLGGTIERSVTLESFAQDDQRVTSTVRHSDGHTETIRSRWIVGCDGAHSTVRHTLGIAFEGAPYEERVIQTDARVGWPRVVDDDEIIVFLTPTGPVACFPFFADGRYRVLKMFTSEPPEAEPTIETFQALMNTVLPETTVTDPEWIVSFKVHHRLAARYKVGRAFLLGDAAHIHSPAGGQGMNTGLQDAHNLAWKLALVAHRRAHPSLVDTYETERRPIARELLRGTDTATRGAGAVVRFRNPVAVGLRNGFMSLVSRLDFVRSRFSQTLSMLDRSYRDSPIVSQYRSSVWASKIVADTESESPGLSAWSRFASAPQPGDRAPDVRFTSTESDGPTRLFALLDRHRHTLLLFDGEVASQAGYRNMALLVEKVGERFGDVVTALLVIPRPSAPEGASLVTTVVLDAERALHDRYGARAECLYLVRPDGHIAYRSQPVDAGHLLRYLDTIFTSVSH